MSSYCGEDYIHSLEQEIERLNKKLNDKKTQVGRQAARIKILEEDIARLKRALREKRETIEMRFEGKLWATKSK